MNLKLELGNFVSKKGKRNKKLKILKLCARIELDANVKEEEVFEDIKNYKNLIIKSINTQLKKKLGSKPFEYNYTDIEVVASEKCKIDKLLVDAITYVVIVRKD